MKNKLFLLLSIFLGSNAFASNSDIKVNAKVLNGCTVQVKDVDFGVVKREDLVKFRSYSGNFKKANNNIELQCSQGINLSISQNGGNAYDGNSNYVSSLNLSKKENIPYAIYTDDVVVNKFNILGDPGNISPAKILTIKATTKEKFNINLLFAMYFPQYNFMTFSADNYKDTISYNFSF